MSKVIRLTESDLTKLVKRVIIEQQSVQNNNKILETFLNEIDEGGNNYFSKWVLDPNNPSKRSGNVKLSGSEANIRTNFINKPLVWSLMEGGKKQKDSVFEIFKYNGKLYYQCISPLKAGIQNSDVYKELGPNLRSAIEQFNQRVFLQEPKY